MRVRFTAHTHSVGERYGVLFGGGRGVGLGGGGIVPVVCGLFDLL